MNPKTPEFEAWFLQLVLKEKDPEITAFYTHPAIKDFIAAHQDSVAYKELSPITFRKIIKDWEEEKDRKEAAEETAQEPERNRPRLKYDNPPLSCIQASEHSLFMSRIALAIAFLLVLTALVFRFIVHPSSDQSTLAVIFALFGLFSYLASNQHNKDSLSKLQKWDLVYRTIEYSPILKNGALVPVTVQILIPVASNTSQTIDRLEKSAKPSLYQLFANAELPPTNAQVWDCIEQQMALCQRDIALEICKMEVILKPAQSPKPIDGISIGE